MRVLSESGGLIVGPGLASEADHSTKRGSRIVTVHSLQINVIREISTTRTNRVTMLRVRTKSMILTLTLYLKTILLRMIRHNDERPRTNITSRSSLNVNAIRPRRVTISSLTKRSRANGIILHVSIRLTSLYLRKHFRLAKGTSLGTLNRKLTIPTRRLFHLFNQARPNVMPNGT